MLSLIIRLAFAWPCKLLCLCYGGFLDSLARKLLAAGCLTALAAVALGAFGAHGLRHSLPPDALSTYHTAVTYQFYHSLGLLAMGLTANSVGPSRGLAWSGVLMATGILLFSGSLYVIALAGLSTLGWVTPVGGLILLGGWAVFAISVLRTNKAG